MHVNIGFRKLGQTNGKALWVVDSVNFSHLQKDRERGENAVLAILLKCIFYTMSTQIFPDGALLTKHKYIKTMQRSCNKCNGLQQATYSKRIWFLDWMVKVGENTEPSIRGTTQAPACIGHQTGKKF